jgi:hypothetical protein
MNDIIRCIDRLLAGHSEDDLRCLVEHPSKLEVIRLARERYQAAERLSEKIDLLELLREIRTGEAILALEDIVAHSKTWDEWVAALEARIYAQSDNIQPFVSSEMEKRRLQSDTEKVNYCIRLLHDMGEQ